MRDRLAIITASVAGVFLAAQYFLTAPAANTAYRTILSWMQVVFAFALVVGVIGVVRLHVDRMGRKRSGWLYSVALLTGVALMTILGFAGGIDRGTAFQWVFDHWQAPMQSTVFSLLAFYVVSAAYRGFRARSGESAVLVVAALVVLLGRVPVGEWLSPILPSIADWVLNVPALAAKRAILIGVGLGMIATSLKVIAGLERTYLGGR
jgi:hypothetical protein